MGLSSKLLIGDPQYEIRITKMSTQSLKSQVNNEKDQLIKGKSTKIAAAFMQNKPNSPNVQMNVTNLITMNYAILASLTKVKNKPNQTQFKPNRRKAKNERKYLLYFRL